MPTPPNLTLEPSANALITMDAIEKSVERLLRDKNVYAEKVYLDDRRFYSLYLHLKATLRMYEDPGIRVSNGSFKFSDLTVYRVVSDDHIEIY